MTRPCVPESPEWIAKPTEILPVTREDLVFVAANATDDGRPYYLFTTRMAVTFGDWQTCAQALDAINASDVAREFGPATFPTAYHRHLNELTQLYDNRDGITLATDVSCWGDRLNDRTAESLCGADGTQQEISRAEENALYPVFRHYLPMNRPINGR